MGGLQRYANRYIPYRHVSKVFVPLLQAIGTQVFMSRGFRTAIKVELFRNGYRKDSPQPRAHSMYIYGIKTLHLDTPKYTIMQIVD